MMKRTAFMVMLFLGSSIWPSASVSATVRVDSLEVFDHAPIQVKDEVTKRETLAIVARAFAIHAWRITEINETDTYIDAELPIRAHIARLRVNLKNKSITFEYRESKNLPHGWFTEGEEWASLKPESEADKEGVHENYNVWVDRVHRTISGLLEVQRFEGGGDE